MSEREMNARILKAFYNDFVPGKYTEAEIEEKIKQVLDDPWPPLPRWHIDGIKSFTQKQNPRYRSL